MVSYYFQIKYGGQESDRMNDNEYIVLLSFS